MTRLRAFMHKHPRALVVAIVGVLIGAYLILRHRAAAAASTDPNAITPAVVNGSNPTDGLIPTGFYDPATGNTYTGGPTGGGGGGGGGGSTGGGGGSTGGGKHKRKPKTPAPSTANRLAQIRKDLAKTGLDPAYRQRLLDTYKRLTGKTYVSGSSARLAQIQKDLLNPATPEAYRLRLLATYSAITGHQWHAPSRKGVPNRTPNPPGGHLSNGGGRLAGGLTVGGR